MNNSALVERSLRHSQRDAAAYAVMMGAGETYLSAFAVFLKVTTPQMGLLSSLPPLLGSLAQMLSAWAGRGGGRRRAIILAGAGVQALAWLPIALLPLLFPDWALPLLIGFAVLYHCGGHFAAPQWASLMGDLVPTKRRGRFFAGRTRTVALVTFISLIAGGFVLEGFAIFDRTLCGFLVLFAVALIARCISIYQVAQMHDPAIGAPQQTDATAVNASWWQQLRSSTFARFSVFYACMQFSVSIASPFFSVYMLRDLEFSYTQYMANTGTSVLLQFLTLARWGRISDVFGNRRVLSVTSLLLPLMPALWLVSTNFFYLLMVQMVSGLVWAGYTLSTGNFLYDLTPADKRPRYLALHNVLAGTGLFAGASLGGYLGTLPVLEIDMSSLSAVASSALLGVFAVSAISRLAVVLIFMPHIREVRRVRPASFSNVIFRVARVNALAGLRFDIVGAQPDKPPRE